MPEVTVLMWSKLSVLDVTVTELIPGGQPEDSYLENFPFATCWLWVLTTTMSDSC